MTTDEKCSDPAHARLAQLDRALASGAKGTPAESEQLPAASKNVPDSLHPTGRHPEGGCECTGAENDLPCEYHETAFDYAMQELNGLHEHRVIRSVVDRLRAEVRRLRDESRLFREAGHAAELRIVELREECKKLIRISSLGMGIDVQGTLKALQEWETELPKLREELARYKRAEDDRTQLAEGAMKLRAKLARVEALPEQWRLQQRIYALQAGAFREAADELETALKDTP